VLTAPRTITNLRSRAEKLAQTCGVDNFEIGLEDIRLLLIIRSCPFGSLEVSIHDGKPMNVVRVEEKISLNKEILFTSD
jgi:hypothetical protein